MNAPVSSTFSIQPEVLYNNLGSKVDGTVKVLGGSGAKYSRKLHMNYISVPIMFQYKATPEFYIEAGPQFSFLTSVKSETTYNTSYTAAELDKTDFNGFDFGVGLGIGFKLSKHVGINARYVAGFSDITKLASDPSTNAKNKNNNFAFGLNFGF